VTGSGRQTFTASKGGLDGLRQGSPADTLKVTQVAQVSAPLQFLRPLVHEFLGIAMGV
jgi:hypothetical protein